MNYKIILEFLTESFCLLLRIIIAEFSSIWFFKSKYWTLFSLNKVFKTLIFSLIDYHLEICCQADCYFMASIWLILRFLCVFVFLKFYYRVLSDILFSFILTVYISVVVSMIYIFQIQKISQPLIFRIVTTSVFLFFPCSLLKFWLGICWTISF